MNTWGQVLMFQDTGCLALSQTLWQFGPHRHPACPSAMENQSQKLADAEPFFDKGKNTGLRHLINAIRFSIRGVRSAWHRESAFRQEVSLLIVLLPVAYIISKTILELIALIAVTLLVLIVELLNSAVEAVVDRAGLEHNELAGLAKDYGSAAVMISLCVAALTWGSMVLRFFGLFD